MATIKELQDENIRITLTLGMAIGLLTKYKHLLSDSDINAYKRINNNINEIYYKGKNNGK